METNIDKASGFSFELVFPKLPGEVEITANEELAINIFGAVIPGLNMDTVEQNWQGGKVQNATGMLTFEPLNIQYMVDSKFLNWYLLYKWMTFINNNKDKYIDNPLDYSVDATIRIVNNFQEEAFRIFFTNVWISTLGEVTLSYREGETILESTADFAYDRFEVRY